MNFFSKLFSSKKENENQKKHSKSNLNNLSAVYREDYFDKRFTEEKLSDNSVIVDGSIKMVEGYFIDNKIEKKINSPVNHPLNLDQVIEEGIGFYNYCKAFNQDDKQIIFTLAFALAEFMIKEFGFKLYKDNEPEFPLRGMTIKYQNNESVLSLYPFEYSLKVLNNESKFNDLYERIKINLNNMPTKEDLFNSLKE